MKQKTKQTLVHWFIFILVGFLLFLAGTRVINAVFIPAYYSMVDNCLPNGNDISTQAGFVTMGQMTVTLGNISSIQIKIANNSESDMIMKHELCHLAQLKRGFLGTCSSEHGKFLRYLAEIECYFKMYL